MVCIRVQQLRCPRNHDHLAFGRRVAPGTDNGDDLHVSLRHGRGSRHAGRHDHHHHARGQHRHADHGLQQRGRGQRAGRGAQLRDPGLPAHQLDHHQRAELGIAVLLYDEDALVRIYEVAECPLDIHVQDFGQRGRVGQRNHHADRQRSGASGVGKSELALELISRGSGLIA